MGRTNDGWTWTGGLRTTCLALVLLLLGSVAARADEVWHGFYTDRMSYEPGDRIQVHVSAPDEQMVFRLVRLDADWTEVTRSSVLQVGPQVTRVGSFVEYPTVTLSGRTAFTLEGWFHPTAIGGDTVVVAGQIGLDEAAAGIVLLPSGELAGYVSNDPKTDLAHAAVAPIPADLSAWLEPWHHLALSYDGAAVRLYVDGTLVAGHAQTGPVADVSTPFRLGARSEAPGDLTGVADGQFDSWALWPRTLAEAEIRDRFERGQKEDDPAPDSSDVDLYLGFEGPFPSIQDGSDHQHVGFVTNYGNPGVTGVRVEGRAFRVNHDQLVDADWNVTVELTIPPDADSGMYAVQQLTESPYAAVRDGDRLSMRSIAIRPGAATPRAPIAVVLPTNTWLAYNPWPGDFGDYLDGPGITPRRRFPGGETRPGGNNSAYNPMGDGVSLAYFHGQHRPGGQASPLLPEESVGEYSVRAPCSMYLVQWLDANGFDYDVYTDDDFDAGRITPADYRVLMPNSHHEYWSDGMLDSLTALLDGGGSAAVPAGNMFQWKVAYDADGVMEVRKYLQAPVRGTADMQSGIDGSYLGTPVLAAPCNPGTEYDGARRYLALGVAAHLNKPVDNKPMSFGKWAARRTDHWLWQGSGLSDGDRFGVGRVPGSGAVGHEVDTWVPGRPLPGLRSGQQPVVLAFGTDFNEKDPGGRNQLLETVGDPEPTCAQIRARAIGSTDSPPSADFSPTDAGTILYFPHRGGGHVLVIGASATPWALSSDPALSGLLERGLTCFIDEFGCATQPGEGSIGTLSTTVGSGFGARRGRVRIGTKRVRVVSWSDTEIRFRLNRSMPPGTYPVSVHPRLRGFPTIVMEGDYAVRSPEIASVGPGSGVAKDRVTITGGFFGTRKGKVQLEYEKNGRMRRRRCRVVEWTMDTATGTSTAVFVVPRRLASQAYTLRLSNRIDSTTAAFTID